MTIGSSKIHLSHIQNVLTKHPSVFEAIVVPIPDEEYNQVSCACIVTKPNTTASSEELKVQFEEQLGIKSGTYESIMSGCPQF